MMEARCPYSKKRSMILIKRLRVGLALFCPLIAEATCRGKAASPKLSKARIGAKRYTKEPSRP
jgi:hypothetical protein